MSYFNNTCFICLKYSYNLTFIKFQDTNGTSIEDKLKYFLSGFELNPNTPKYICTECGFTLNKCYEFKQICLQNITTYETYAQQITTTDSSNKYLSVGPVEIFKVNNLELQTEKDKDIRKNEAIIVKEEINEELPDIKQENLQSGDTWPVFVDCNAKISDENNYEAQSEINQDVLNSEELFIKEETVLNDESNALLHDIKEKNSESSSAGNENEKLYKCKICNKLYKCARNLKMHELIHVGGRVHTCDICNKSFRQLENLQDHRLLHNREKPFSCEVCNKSFEYIGSLKTHQLVHTGEKPFTCEVCNKSFHRVDILKNHQLIHTKEKPFTCEVCNKTFRRLSNLKDHQLLHTEEKPFTCKVCNKSFRRLNNLEHHSLVHTGEKPFTCEVCNTSFRYFYLLKSHKLLHTGEKPFTCEVCNKSFRHLNTLKNHRLIHTGEKPLTCEVCNKSFRYFQALKKHKLEHTG